MNIEQIALEVAREMNTYCETEFDEYTHRCFEFSEQELCEFLRRCLSKMAEGMEPVGFFGATDSGDTEIFTSQKAWSFQIPLYVTPAEAILAAENTVAEACAKLIWFLYAEECKKKMLNPHHFGEWLIGPNEIRAGKWREYK